MISPEDHYHVAPGTEAPAIVTRHQLLLRRSRVVYDEDHQTSPSQQSLAVDLNRILERVEYTLETCSDESDLEFAESALRVVDGLALGHALRTSAQPGGDAA